MDPILIFSDDTRAQNNDFIITTMIWGDPRECQDFQKCICNVARRNQAILGKTFKAFKGSALNARNWRRFSPIYIELIDKLEESLKRGELQMLIYIESRQKYNANVRFLERELREAIFRPGHSFSRIFGEKTPQDLVPYYKSCAALYSYLLHREFIGNPKCEFHYYPDSSGTILRYANRKTSLQTNSKKFGNVAIIDDYFNILVLIANSLDAVLSRELWKRSYDQKLVKFRPMLDEDSYIIQTADVICHLIYHLIRHTVGIADPISRLKSEILLRYNFPANKSILQNINASFAIRAGKCVCINPDLKANIIDKGLLRKLVPK